MKNISLTEKEKKRHPYTNPYGMWKVTTEGDCEGRSSRMKDTLTTSHFIWQTKRIILWNSKK